jgi:LuxR family maltose regulon positive regulatory protein
MSIMDELWGSGVKAALISAPAGFGKTTLVAQWLKTQPGLASVWLSLDEEDNQADRFFQYFFSAIDSLFPSVAERAQQLVNLPGLSLEEIMMSLSNELLKLSVPFVLILDDLHVITNQHLHRALVSLLNTLPSHMRVIILCREDPPIQISRLRSRNQLIEIRQQDLRFSQPEATDFLNQCMKLQLSPIQVDLLENRTEGWIGGLQMAGLSLQKTKDNDKFIRDFSGSNYYIMDYLLDEVFNTQSENLRGFLLKTSVLDRMTAELCSAVTQKTIKESQDLLDQLINNNIFIFALDDERQWYRYHHLFKDLLFSRLCEDEHYSRSQLLLSASHWYENKGDSLSAVEYAFKANDFQRVADLIEQNISEHWQISNRHFMFFVNRLPNEIIISRPALSLQKAWTCVLSSKMHEAQQFIEAADKQLSARNRFEEPGDDTNRGFVKILKAYLSDYFNYPVVMDKNLLSAIDLIPESNIGMRNSVEVVMGTICYMEGDFQKALRFFESAISRDKKHNGTNAIPVSVWRMVWVLQKKGNLSQALMIITESEKYLSQHGKRRFYIGGVIYLLWAEILIEWNRLDEAQAQISEGMRLLEDWPLPHALCFGYCLLARLQIARNNFIEARATLSIAEDLEIKNELHPEIRNILERTQIQLWRCERNLIALNQYMQKFTSENAFNYHSRNVSHLLQISKACLILGKSDLAIILLGQLLDLEANHKGTLIEILILHSVATKNDVNLALQSLDRALNLAQPEDYYRVFIDEGEPLKILLQNWLSKYSKDNNGPFVKYVRNLLKGFNITHLKSNQRSQVHNLIEPLSKRELEVLRLLAEGLTNQQIANKLFISIRTVKKHVENIHGKLNVQNRTQAVSTALSLGLLDSPR